MDWRKYKIEEDGPFFPAGFIDIIRNPLKRLANYCHGYLTEEKIRMILASMCSNPSPALLPFL
jgi:hypothetical protein